MPVDRDGNPLRYEPRPVVNRMGYRKDTGQDRRWMVLPEVWRAEFCAGHDPAKVAEILAARNMLEKGDGNHLAKKVRVEDRSIRAYVLTPAIFEA